jgi:hypothetical protein
MQEKRMPGGAQREQIPWEECFSQVLVLVENSAGEKAGRSLCSGWGSAV